jgi:isoleucyl-tRNA synthetase
MTETKAPDYKDTVFLPKTEFPIRGNLPQLEPTLLERWKSMGLYDRLREQAAGRTKFILHDGPPYANGNIHLGTALTKILKDTVNRSYQMLGFDAPYVPGWDCHGLPIEWKIEEQYRAKGMDKDQVPIVQFRAECRAFADHWKNVQSVEFQRLGVVADWAKPYATMTFRAEAQILREMYKFLQNGLLYRGTKPIMWSVVEKTALAEAEIEYHDHKSTTIWVKFPVVKTKNKALEGASVIIWTTTPWTIPANRAIAHGNFDYVLVRVEEIAEGSLAKAGEHVIVADALLTQFATDAKIARVEKVASLKMGDLAGIICHHPLHGRSGSEDYFDFDVPLLEGDFVTTEAGTGFVHIAPGHGEDDYNLGKQYGIEIPETVGDDGQYLSQVKGFAGLAVYKPDGKVGEANGAVMKALLEAGAMLAKKNITHSYPHSWRSKAPLIFRTTPQWFIAMDRAPEGHTDTLRELAMKAIGETKWFPPVGENRIRGMVQDRPDWCISRQRAWGVPIALFVNKQTGQVLKDAVVLDRIAKSFDHDGADAWYSRPAQEFLGSGYKAEDFQQIFDVVDVWFESGSTHAFCLDQNNGSSEWPNLQTPADLYCEGSDQHRGWFQSSLMEACGTLGHAPFKNVLTNGFTLDEQGRKMSKSLGNVVAPQEVTEKMGADILRLWVMSTDYMQDMRAGAEIFKQTSDLYRRFRNTLRYLLGAIDGFTPAEQVSYVELPELERWTLHRMAEVDATLRADIAKFDFNHLLITLHDLCNSDLSAFYFDIRKDTLYCDRPDNLRRRSARTVMAHVFDHLVSWLAPVLCFTAEEAWLARHPDNKQGSVHLQTFPSVPKEWCNDDLGSKWVDIRALRRVVTGALEQARNDKKIGSSLQAHPHIYIDAKQQAVLSHLDVAELCISSNATVKATAAPDGAYVLPDVPGAGVVFTLAEGVKCERCWKILPEVGSHKDYPELCTRCHDAVTHLRCEAA